MKAVIYARFSSHSQTEQSIEGQERVCRQYAKDHGLEISHVYVDRAITGRTDARPDFQRMLDDASKHKFQALIVYKTDRFARNKYDSAIYKQKLRKAGVEIHYAAESIPAGPEGIILESLMEGLAEYYSAELSQKVKRGMHESAMKGHSTGGRRSFGYKTGADMALVIDEDEAKAVQMIFDMFLGGNTYADICTKLNAMGYKTSTGKDFGRSSLSTILRNKKYIGVYEYDGVRISDGIPPIIDLATFQSAQKELQKRERHKVKAITKDEYLLAGKVYCGLCGEKMTGMSGTSRNTSKYRYYVCPSRKAEIKCKKKNVSASWLEETVAKETKHHLLTPENIEKIVDACHELQLRDLDTSTLEFLEKKLAETKKAASNIIKMIETGIVTESLPARLRELEDEQLAIQGEIEAAKSAQFIINKEQLTYLLNQMKETKDILRSFVSKVFVYDNNLIVWYNLTGAKSEICLSDLDAGDEQFDLSSICSTKEIPYSFEYGISFIMQCGLEGSGVNDSPVDCQSRPRPEPQRRRVRGKHDSRIIGI